MKIAVVGAGISGIVSALLLSKKNQVTIFEKENRLGGHTNTRVLATGPDAGLAIDTGFIVCNPKNYPNFYKFLNQLEIKLQDSDMSFGFWSAADNLQYVGPALKDFLKTPTNFLRPDFLRLALDQHKFNRALLKSLAENSISNISLGEYCAKLNLSAAFLDFYLRPLIGAIWSSPETDTNDFPAKTFATFFNNHGMLNLGTFSKWQTLVGGSKAYLEAFENKFQGEILTGQAVTQLNRNSAGVHLKLSNEKEFAFDYVVLACHAPQSLALLGDASSAETEALAAWNYTNNAICLHTDSRVMPKKKSLWAAWNYNKNDASSEQVQITYYMNRLQNLVAQQDYFVTLNQNTMIDNSKIIYETVYQHPVYTPNSVSAQKLLQQINGQNKTFYAGAYLGYGFHEDGVNSALAVCRHFEAAL